MSLQLAFCSCSLECENEPKLSGAYTCIILVVKNTIHLESNLFTQDSEMPEEHSMTD